MKQVFLLVLISISLLFSGCAKCVASHEVPSVIYIPYCAVYGRKGQCYYYEYLPVPTTNTICDKWIDN